MPTTLELQLAADKAALATAIATEQSADAAASAANMQLAADQNAASMADAKLAASIKDAAVKVDVQAKAHVAVATAQQAVAATVAAIAAATPVDLAPLLKAAKPGDTIAPGAASYVLNETLDYKTANVTVDLAGAPITCTPTPGASSNIVAHAPGFHAKRWNVVKAAVLFRAYASDFSLTDSTVDNCISAVLTDETGVRPVITGNHFGGSIQSVVCYVTTNDSVIDSNTFDGSLGEYCVRYEVSNAHVKPTGGKLTRNKIRNKNAYGKEAIGARMIDNLDVYGNQIWGTIRWGQEAPAGYPAIADATVCNNNCTQSGNEFFDIPDGGAGVRIHQGVTLAITADRYHQGPNTVPISQSAPSKVTATSCVRIPAPGVTPKPLRASSSIGEWTEAGTQTVSA